MDWPPALFPIAFVGLWLAVAWVLAEAGGWAALRRRYPDPGTRSVAFRWIGRGSLGEVSYRNVLRVGASPAGLHLRVMFLFAFRHGRICVPWNLVEVGEAETFLWSEQRELRLGEGRTRLRLPEPVWQRVRADAGPVALGGGEPVPSG